MRADRYQFMPLDTTSFDATGAQRPPADPARTTGQRLTAVSSLLDNLETPAQTSLHDSSDLLVFENQLVQVRLGLASSLFAALRAKHAPTAAHSLRVALGCSAWGAALGMGDADRDQLEIAALLHDVGKIGVPDQILLKPTKLTPEEFLIVERHRQIGIDILRACSASMEVLRTVKYAGAWFDGTRDGYDLRSEQLPAGARMVAIVDAFDAMTSDQVYRRAMSRERALAELFEFAGTQFDPRLVQEFCTYISADQVKLQSLVCRRWLKQLQPEAAAGHWKLAQGSLAAHASGDSQFSQKLMESMPDAVIFVDSSLRIVHWNRAAERLTGIASASIEHKHWSPSLVSLRDERNKLILEPECPLIQSLKNGVQTLRRLSVTGRGGQQVDVDAHLLPVHGKNGLTQGVALLLHDASSQVTLEQRVQCLHEKATRDPLTQVANRAEFDRFHTSAVQTHLERRLPFSLIICDIDHFKQVNDTYGHQAGDEVLIAFAALLRRHCRVGDLVARFGGEEFVMLCVDCDNATATRIAEEIRAELAEFPLPMLQGKSVTASFGVTELQSGDTPETMLRRADRALYQAKENGRNMVVQLGSGIAGEDAPAKPTGWFAWFRGATPDQVLQRTLATSMPFNVVVEKMRGFVADHYAQIEAIAENHVALKIGAGESPLTRRSSDRAVPFVIELKFDDGRDSPQKLGAAKLVRTLVQVTIRPQRNRDRRRRDVLERAQKLLASLKSYLVAQDYKEEPARPAAASSSTAAATPSE